MTAHCKLNSVIMVDFAGSVNNHPRWNPHVNEHLTCIAIADNNHYRCQNVAAFNDNSERVGLLPRLQNRVKFAPTIHRYLRDNRGAATCSARVTGRPMRADASTPGQGARVPCVLTITGSLKSLEKLHGDLTSSSSSE